MKDTIFVKRRVTDHSVLREKSWEASFASKDDVKHNKSRIGRVDSGVTEHSVNKLLYFDKVQQYWPIQLTMVDRAKT